MEQPNSADVMYIANNCNINGTINSSGNVTIEGQVEGTLSVKGDLIIGEQAKVKADIEAENIQIKGEVQGKIIVHSLLEVSPTGILVGDIITKHLKIDRGAKFIGTSTHTDEKTIENPKEPKESKFGFKPVIYNRLAK